MKNYDSEIWTHLVLRTRNGLPVFFYPEITIVQQAIEDFAGHHEDQPITFSVIPNKVHILLKMPVSMTLDGLAEHLKTYISAKLRKSFGESNTFEWENEFDGYAVSINKLTSQKLILSNLKIENKDRPLDLILKSPGY